MSARSAGPSPVPVSVVIPSYNHAAFLRQAVESVLAQTRPPAEIILIDDGSRDGSPALCRDLAAAHGSIRVLLQRNQGAHAALNRGISLAAGPWIAVCNSDDLFRPDKLARCLRLLAQAPRAEVVFGRVEIIDDRGERQRGGTAVEWLGRAEAFRRAAKSLALALVNENFAATTSNMVFAKAFWERAGGFRPLRYCHDWDFILTAAEEGRLLYDPGAAHIGYRVHARNTIAEDLRNVRVEIAAVLAAHALRPAWRSLAADSRQGRLLHQALEAKGVASLALALQPVRAAAADDESFYRGVTRKGQPYRDWIRA